MDGVVFLDSDTRSFFYTKESRPVRHDVIRMCLEGSFLKRSALNREQSLNSAVVGVMGDFCGDFSIIASVIIWFVIPVVSL